ncbi:MAG TPA: exodeoxyribonuclease VII small subunit [Bacteroidota bacterium]|nr:exodeoxyribonuclease VII small subunit [Bacteroidota bacterium]
MTAKKTRQDETFEEALHRLEEIVQRLEQGDVPLEQAMQLYEEGVALSRTCAEKLKSAELTLQKLSKDAAGTFTLTDEDA